MFKSLFQSLLVFLFVSYLPLKAEAEDQLIADSLFLGSSGSGGASLRGDLYYLINPAVLGFHQGTKGALAYSGDFKQNMAWLSFTDIRNKFPLAVTYQRLWLDSFTDKGKNKIILSSGFKLSPVFSVGFNMERTLKPFTWNAGLGSFFRLNSRFAMALFLDKMFKEKNQNFRRLTLASSYNWRQFFWTQLDVSRSTQQYWLFKLNFESVFHSYFSINFGGQVKTKQINFEEIEGLLFSGGLNFHSPKLILGYGVQTDQESLQHSLSLIVKTR